MAGARGFSRVTVDELAERAGVSKRTIYRYFKNKEDIVHFILKDLLSVTEAKVDKTLSSFGNPIEKVTNVLRVIIENLKLFQPITLYDLQKYYPHLWEEIEQFRSKKLRQTFETLLLNDDKGCFRRINPQIFSTALMAGVKSVINPVFITENNLSLEESIQSLFSIYLYGIVDDTERSR